MTFSIVRFRKILWGSPLITATLTSLIFWPFLYHLFSIRDVGKIVLILQSGSLLAPFFGGVFGGVFLHNHKIFQNARLFSEAVRGFCFSLILCSIVLSGIALFIDPNGNLILLIMSNSLCQAAIIIQLIYFRVYDKIIPFFLTVNLVQFWIPFLVFVGLGKSLNINILFSINNILLATSVLLIPRISQLIGIRTFIHFYIKKSLEYLPNHIAGLVLLLGSKYFVGAFHGLEEVGWYQIPSLYGGGFVTAAILIAPLTHRRILEENQNLSNLYRFGKVTHRFLYTSVFFIPLISSWLIWIMSPSKLRISDQVISGIVLGVVAPLVWLSEYLISIYLSRNQNAFLLNFANLPAILIIVLSSMIPFGSAIVNVSLGIYFAYLIRIFLQIDLDISIQSFREEIAKLVKRLFFFGIIGGVISYSAVIYLNIF